MAAPESTTYADLKPKWRERFAFFDAYGRPGSREFRAAFRALPFRKRVLINSNWIAFFFGPIYFFVIGLWKKGITLLGIWFAVVVGVVTFEAMSGFVTPDAVATGIGAGMAALYMTVANYAYYLHRAKGAQNWNPFEGWARRGWLV